MAAPQQIKCTETVKAGKAYRVSTIKIREEDYETMVFPGESYREVVGIRYDNRREALAGHAEYVAQYSD